MKKFLLKVALFIAILVLYKLIILCFVIATLPGDEKNYYGESEGNSRIILVGSSNLDCNYDYAKISEALPNFDAIGSSLNEPSGVYASLYKLRALKPGAEDIIVFCLPHSHYESEKFFPLKTFKKRGYDGNLLAEAAVEFPVEFIKSLGSVNAKDVYKLLTEKGNMEKKVFEEITFTGAPIVHSNEKYISCWTNPEDMFFTSSTAFEEDHVEELMDYLSTSFESKVFFRFPPMKEGEFEVSYDRIEFQKQNYSYLNDFESTIYPHEYWYNQWYHLNACGRDLQTESLIEELKEQVLNTEE